MATLLCLVCLAGPALADDQPIQDFDFSVEGDQPPAETDCQCSLAPAGESSIPTSSPTSPPPSSAINTTEMVVLGSNALKAEAVEALTAEQATAEGVYVATEEGNVVYLSTADTAVSGVGEVVGTRTVGALLTEVAAPFLIFNVIGIAGGDNPDPTRIHPSNPDTGHWETIWEVGDYPIIKQWVPNGPEEPPATPGPPSTDPVGPDQPTELPVPPTDPLEPGYPWTPFAPRPLELPGIPQLDPDHKPGYPGYDPTDDDCSSIICVPVASAPGPDQPAKPDQPTEPAVAPADPGKDLEPPKTDETTPGAQPSESLGELLKAAKGGPDELSAAVEKIRAADPSQIDRVAELLVLGKAVDEGFIELAHRREQEAGEELDKANTPDERAAAEEKLRNARIAVATAEGDLDAMRPLRDALAIAMLLAADRLELDPH